MENTVPVRKDNYIWDFVLLNPLTEDTFLRTLFCRYKQDQIYTYIGNELVSVNPYKNLEIYSKNVAVMYLHKAPFLLPPHIFSIIATAYRWLNDSNEDQCIIISGESGSGKTETLKKMLSFLSFVIDNTDFNVKDHVIHANFILEVFGNAETSFNKNSSRFGKLLDIEFNLSGDPVSASFTSYLLDKDRVTSQRFGERNFHIFYQLLNGADIHLLKVLKLHRNILMYSLLKCGGLSLNSNEDKKNFLVFKKSMELLNFDYNLLVDILKIISVILKLGDLVFVSTTNIDGTEGCAISNEHEVYDICQLFGIDANIFQTAITCRSVRVQQNSDVALITTEMLADEASQFRDRLCKALYSRLFTWLVKNINSKIKTQLHYRKRHILLLDLFGFENFEKNEFHQFVVNYTNEKFFQFICERNIRNEQEEYVREGIEWTPVDYLGDSVIYEMNSKIYEEVFSILNKSYDECNILENEHSIVQRLEKLKFGISTDTSKTQNASELQFNCFKVQHYAGIVTYDGFSFVHKNSCSVSSDLSVVMYSASHPLLKFLFPEGSPVTSSLKKQPSPIGKQIKIALNGILRNINNKKLYYVRCMKPNEMKEPHIFETDMLLRQIRSQKIIEIVRLRRNGFSFCLPHTQFLNRYKMLSLKTWPSSRLLPIQSIQYLLHDLPIPSAEFAFGTTKMFIRSPRSVYELEEYRRQRLNDIATIIQSIWRKFSARKKFLRMRRSQIIIATAWRIYKKRRENSLIKSKRQIDWAVEIIQRHYIQWKRYQFLNRLINELGPRTLSPLNRDWPSCNIRLTETSLLLRKLHHKWRCQRYRSQFNQTMRNKMREKVTASFLFKDKKCCYAGSISRPFYGDYIRLRLNTQWRKLCYGGDDQHVVFADVIYKIARSTGKFIPMLLAISTNSMMIMDQRTLDIKYRIPVSEIHRISVSPFADNIAVIHIYSSDKSSNDGDTSQCFSSTSTMKSHSSCFFMSDYYEKGDIIFQTSHVIEVATKLFLVVQNAVGRPPDVNISTLFNAYFHQQIVTISFYLTSSTAGMQLEQIKVFRKGNKMEICILNE